MKQGLLCAMIALFVLPSVGLAQGINTNVALAVAEDEAILRSQLRYRRATDDPFGLGRQFDALLAPQTLVYGITPKLTAFATLPVLAHRRLKSADGSVSKGSAVGDFRLIGRYTVYADDYAPLSTRRAALLVGLKFPTGSSGFGTASFDPIFGAVATWASNRHEIDVDALYAVTTKRHGVEAGDEFRYDLAYRYRLWPKHFGGRLLQLNGLLELNGLWRGRTRSRGAALGASGGSTLLLSPGAQFITQRFIVEASVQVPIWQDLNGPQLEDDFTAVLSVRIPFTVGMR